MVILDLRIYNKLLVLILISNTVRTKDFTLKGALDFQSLSRVRFSQLGE